MDKTESAARQFVRLIRIMEDLRGENGCPWDKEQTAKSLVPYLLEETYEIIEAIEEKNSELLREELGDLMLHIVFQAHIADEDGKFSIADSLKHICDKLVRRHPHVFGDQNTQDQKVIKQTWEAIKLKENKRSSMLDGVPKNLPALTRARRIQEKASNVGFDWREIQPVWNILYEELEELKEAEKTGDFERIEEELGDVLFSVVNLGRFLKVSSEEALRITIAKFERRFNRIEERLKKNGSSLEKATLEEMDALWNDVKREEKEEI